MEVRRDLSKISSNLVTKLQVKNRQASVAPSLVEDLLQSGCEVASQMLCPVENAELKFLGRTVRLKSDGIEWEGDTLYHVDLQARK